MRELRTGVWHWQSRHPEWTPECHWRPEVSSYAIDDGERLLLFDPLAVPSELEQRVADRTPVIVLAGDTLADFGRGFELPPEWLRTGVTREAVAGRLRPLRDLPVEL